MSILFIPQPVLFRPWDRFIPTSTKIKNIQSIIICPHEQIYFHTFRTVRPLPFLAMLHIRWGPRSIWTFLVLVVSQRLLTAQIDQYYEVSQEAFLDIVVYNCERHVSHSGTIMECSLFCSVPGRPRCSALALGSDFCWVCGEDTGGPYSADDATDATEFWVHSGRWEHTALI